MRKLIFAIIMATMLAGCTSNNVNTFSGSVPSGGVGAVESEIPKVEPKATLQPRRILEEDKAQGIARKLLDDFHRFYNNMPKDDMKFENTGHTYKRVSGTDYSKIMAADRSVALLGVYRKYISQEDAELIESKQKEINNLEMSLVQYGYTESGLHFMTLQTQNTKFSLEYLDVCNIIRNDNNESELFNKARYEGNLSLYDIYVEDLTGERDEVHVEFKFGGSAVGGDFVEDEAQYNFDENIKELFKKYNRDIPIKSDIIYMNTWRLFAVQNQKGTIFVSADGEEVELVRHY